MITLIYLNSLADIYYTVTIKVSEFATFSHNSSLNNTEVSFYPSTTGAIDIRITASNNEAHGVKQSLATTKSIAFTNSKYHMVS